MDQYNPKGLTGWDDFWNNMSDERKKVFNDMVKSLSEEINQNYGPTLRDFQAALDNHTSAVKIILDMTESEREAAVTSLAKSVTDLLQQRNEKWKGVGSKLGDTVRLGIKSALGI